MKYLWKKWIYIAHAPVYSSISLPGSGSRFRIRIQPGNLNPDPAGSRSETQGTTEIIGIYAALGSH